MWIIARTKTNQEALAKLNVERQSEKCEEVYLPLIQDRKHRLPLPLFRSYLFVNVDQTWRWLLSTYGVTSVVMMGSSPARLPDREVDKIRDQEKEGIVILPELRFELGQRVRLTEGAFKNFVGLYDGQSSKDRERVLLRILGYETPVTIAPEFVVAV